MPPKIKIYQLAKGYTSDSDNDIQVASLDELVPVKDKPLSPEDFYLLTGVKHSEAIPIGIDLASGLLETNLIEGGAQTQTFENEETLMLPSGYYKPKVINALSEIVPESNYTLGENGVVFSATPYPSGAKIAYYRKTSSGQNFVSPVAPLYGGENYAFRSFLKKNGEVIECTINAETGLITLSESENQADLTLDCYYLAETTNLFIGEHENWLPGNLDDSDNGHLYMGVDVFKGVEDYSGDNSTDSSGNTVVQGEIPKYMSSGFQINYRDGSVTFASEVNSTTYPVHASYACFLGIHNVTGQNLSSIASPSGQYRYKVSEDKKYPESVGAMWLGRDNDYTPRTIYVEGEACPKLLSTAPYDKLTVKTEA